MISQMYSNLEHDDRMTVKETEQIVEDHGQTIHEFLRQHPHSDTYRVDTIERWLGY